MPSISQSLFWSYIHIEAKISVLTNSSANLWHEPSLKEKEKLLSVNWYDFHQIYTLSFSVDSVEGEDPKIPLIISFFFLNPRWFLVNEFDSTIKKCWDLSLSSSVKPSIVTSLNGSPTSCLWFLLKQNDPDLLRLIVTRIIQNKIFIPPFTRFILTPLGITPPIIKPLKFSPTPLNIDPTSNSQIKGGHKFTQKLCNSSGFLTRPKILLILSDKVG